VSDYCLTPIFFNYIIARTSYILRWWWWWWWYPLCTRQHTELAFFI